MSINTLVKGLQSEIFVPVTPPPVWTEVNKDIKDMKLALVTAAGVHLKSDEKFNLAGDFTFRRIPGDVSTDELMVTHGGYDNADANRDINCMFPLKRVQELEKEGFIKKIASSHYGFMGGGGDQAKLREETGPAIARLLKEDGVDAVLMTAG